MVKADVKQNYYADLDLPTTATTEEIKKQYRTLARLYHPDRNPGKEVEFNAKFQCIQAAHEILTDPDQRRIYDAERRKSGYGGMRSQSAYAGTQQQQRGPGQSPFAAGRSPYATYSNFAPPPKRNPNPTPNPTKPKPQPQYAHGTGPSPGAARAANFARAPRPKAQGGFANTKDDEEAWRRMRAHNAAEQQQRASSAAAGNQPWSDDDFRRGRSAHDAAGVPPSKPQFSRSNTTKSPRKGGFDPSAPGAGDWEPQAPSYSSYRPVPPVPTATKPQPPPVPPRSPQAPPSSRPNKNSANMFRAANGEEDVPFTEGARIRTPYTSHSGERTYFSNKESVRRSASVREGGQASASSTPERPSPRGNHARHRSHSPSGRTATPAENSFSPQASARKALGTQQRRKPVVIDHSSLLEPSAESDDSTKLMSGIPADPVLGNRTKAKPGSFWKRSDSPLKDQVPGSKPAPNTPLNGQSRPQMFDIPKGYETETHSGLKSASTDNISTTFNQSAWEGKFQGSKDFMPQTLPTRKGSKTTPLGRTPRQPSDAQPPGFQNNPIDVPSPAGMKMPPPPPPPMPNGTSTFNPGPVKFSSEDWARHLKDQTFFLPTERPTSPSKMNSSSTRRPKSVRSRKQSRVATNGPAPPAVVISDASDEDSEAQPGKTKGTSHPRVEEPEPMDIDSEIPGAFGATSPNSTRGPRLVNIPPARPEWRDGHTTSTTAVPTAAGGKVPSGTIPTAVPKAAVPPPPPMPPPQPKTTAKKARVKKNSIDLTDLKNVTPLGPSGSEGLQGFSDLTGTLPFKSQPSAHPLRTFEPLDVELPVPPKAPTVLSTSIRMTEAQWKSYVGQMSYYMGKWYEFDGMYVKHFMDRQRSSEKFGTGIPSTAAAKALEAIGESSTEEGLLSYVKGLQEDVRVRKHWDLAHDNHKVVMEEFAKVKERVKTMGLAPT